MQHCRHWLAHSAVPPCVVSLCFCSEMFGMWFVIVMALGGVANHVLTPNAGHGMGYLAIAVQFGFAFAFPVRHHV